jgi:hypothetical protein
MIADDVIAGDESNGPPVVRRTVRSSVGAGQSAGDPGDWTDHSGGGPMLGLQAWPGRNPSGAI